MKTLSRQEMLMALVGALGVVATLRAGPLDLPYWWDEGDVYVPGARWVAAHGFDIVPGSFPDDWSRGHPPLFFLVMGIVFAIFGSAPAVGHGAMVPLTVLSLAGTYIMAAERFGRATGLAAAVLLGTTPLFLSIGAMVLPEVALVTLTVLAFWAVSRGWLRTAVIAGVLAVWTKETGVFTVGAVGVVIAWDGLRRGLLRDGGLWRRLAWASLPLAALAAFFGWQKLTAGYFVFPHHQNLFWDRPLAWQDVSTVVPSLLLWHGRWVALSAAVVTGLLALRRGSDGACDAPEAWRPSTEAWMVGWLSLLVVNALFFTKMFWLERYALPVHPGVCIALAAATVGSAERAGARTALGWVPVGMTALLQWLGTSQDPGADQEELTFAYAEVIATHQQAFAALTEHLGEDAAPVLTTWPMTTELREPSLGFVARPYPAMHIDHYGGEAVDAALISSSASQKEVLEQIARRQGLERAGRFDAGAGPRLTLWLR